MRRKEAYNTASPEEQTKLFINELEFEFDVFGKTPRITSASPTPKTGPEVRRNNVRNHSTSKTATEAEFKSAVAEVEKELGKYTEAISGQFFYAVKNKLPEDTTVGRRCFLCHQRGHQSKDCPGSKVKVAAVKNAAHTQEARHQQLGAVVRQEAQYQSQGTSFEPDTQSTPLLVDSGSDFFIMGNEKICKIIVGVMFDPASLECDICYSTAAGIGTSCASLVATYHGQSVVYDGNCPYQIVGVTSLLSILQQGDEKAACTYQGECLTFTYKGEDIIKVSKANDGCYYLELERLMQLLNSLKISCVGPPLVINTHV